MCLQGLSSMEFPVRATSEETLFRAADNGLTEWQTVTAALWPPVDACPSGHKEGDMEGQHSEAAIACGQNSSRPSQLVACSRGLMQAAASAAVSAAPQKRQR